MIRLPEPEASAEVDSPFGPLRMGVIGPSTILVQSRAQRARVEGRSRAPPANAVRASTRAFQARLSMRGGRS